MEWYHWFEECVLGGLGSTGCRRWAFVDYLDTKYPKTWFVARRMLTVTTGA